MSHHRRGDREPDLRAVAIAESKISGDTRPLLTALSARQRAFVVAYLWGEGGARFNASAAARAAGYSWPAQAGARLMRSEPTAGLIREILETKLGDRPGRRIAS
jgi:hypothetical protein